MLLFNYSEQILDSVGLEDIITLDDDVILVIHHGNDRKCGQRRPLVEVFELGFSLNFIRLSLVELSREIINKLL